MMLTKSESFFSLGDSAQHLSITVFKSILCLVQELNSLVKIFELTTGTDRDGGILHWVKTIVQVFDHSIVQCDQVSIFLSSIKSFVLKILDQRICNIVPQPTNQIRFRSFLTVGEANLLFLEEISDVCDLVSHVWVLGFMVIQHCKWALNCLCHLY